MKGIIEVNNISKKFKDVSAVSDLSFTVGEGDVYGFLGQNGAGKSTTIRMLLTLIRPTSGSISIFNKDLFVHREEILKHTGAIIEKPDLYNYLSAYDNIAFLSKVSGKKVSRSTIMQHLSMVGLAKRYDSKVITFSQGMKQRLGIAATLIHDPALIILDEPTNGLDPQGIADVRGLIQSLSQSQGKTILVSSHLLSEIELIANKILIIHKGKKIVEGFANDLFDPAKTIVEINTDDIAFAMHIVKQSEWAVYVTNTILSDKLLFQMDKMQVPFLIKYLAANNINILSAELRNSLENYFLSLTNPDIYVEPAAV